jgi:hypothetical protein
LAIAGSAAASRITNRIDTRNAVRLASLLHPVVSWILPRRHSVLPANGD